MSFNTKVRVFQLIVQLMAIFSIYYMIAHGAYSWLWVVLFAYIFIGPVSIGLTLHRMLTHRSFKTWKWLEDTLSVLSVFTVLGPTITWVGLHRFHHANSDSDLDPHSPYNIKTDKFSIKHAFIAWSGIGWTIPQIPLRYVKDLMRSSLHKFILNNYFKILITGIVLMYLINPILPLYMFFLPCALAFHGVNMINVFGHKHGYRNFDTDDHSTNSWFTHILTWEGLHNNHHQYPGSWDNQVKWWEIDPLKYIIKLIRVND